MTYEMALTRLNSILKKFGSELSDSDWSAFDLIDTALSRRIKVKPENRGKHGFYCPSCKLRRVENEHRCCPFCGQKLDWSEV